MSSPETKPRSRSFQRASTSETDGLHLFQPDDGLGIHVDRIGDDSVSQSLFQLRDALHFLGNLTQIDRYLATSTPLGAVKRYLDTSPQILEIIAGEEIDGAIKGGGKAVVKIVKGRRARP